MARTSKGKGKGALQAKSGKAIGTKVSKSKLNKKIKTQSKATKSKIEKLNANLEEINDIKSSLFSISSQEKTNPSALNYKDIKTDFKKDEKIKELNKIANNDLTKQLELITGFEL